MLVNSTHADYDAALPGWIRAHDLLAGEDAAKAAGAKYLPRLDGQTDEDYLAYQSRACFSKATRRAADAFVGLVFRKTPFVKIPESQDGIGKAMARFSNDADMLGTSLFGYAKNVVREVISVGRAGTLLDWERDYEQRAGLRLCRRTSGLPRNCGLGPSQRMGGTKASRRRCEELTTARIRFRKSLIIKGHILRFRAFCRFFHTFGGLRYYN